MNIEELIERYFEGDTSPAEEKILAEYFSGKEIKSDLIRYKPLFDLLGSEKDIRHPDEDFARNFIKKLVPQNGKVRKFRSLFWLSGIAATLLIMFGLGYYFLNNSEKSFVEINNNHVLSQRNLSQTPAPQKTDLIEKPKLNGKVASLDQAHSITKKTHRVPSKSSSDARQLEATNKLVISQTDHAFEIIRDNLALIDRNLDRLSIIDSSLDKVYNSKEINRYKSLIINNSGDVK
jgi:hypothetical protein